MSVKLSCALSSRFVPVSQQVRLLYAYLEIDARDAAPVALPVNLSVVVDDSESMRLPLLTQEQFERLKKMGQVREVERDGVKVFEFRGVPEHAVPDLVRPLDFVKTALRQVLEHLSNEDRFALVAFASRTQVLIPNESGSKRRALLKAIDDLDRLNLGDETFMAAGLKLGYDEVRKGLGQRFLNRLVVLTDGFTKDESQCRQLAQKIADDGITVSTIGIGGGFNEDLMIALADLTGGEAHFVLDPNDIPRIFQQELQAVRSVALTGAQLQLHTVQGVELRRATKVKPALAPLSRMRGAERLTVIPLGDLKGDEPHGILLELLIPPRQEGSVRLAQAKLLWDTGHGTRDAGAKADIVVTYTPDESLCRQLDPEVMRFVERATAADLQTRALQDLAAGNVTAATKKLEAAATRLLSTGDTAQAQQALEAARSLSQHGQVAPEVTKRLRYETRRLR